jgi:hypothetical protein
MTPTRRRYPRLVANNAALLERAGPEPEGVFGLTRDLGPGGCGLISPAAFGAGAFLNLFLAIESEVLEAEGRVIHESSRPDGRYDLGVEILRMDQVHRARYNLRFAGMQGDGPLAPPNGEASS